jgi:hypothetical protein
MFYPNEAIKEKSRRDWTHSILYITHLSSLLLSSLSSPQCLLHHITSQPHNITISSKEVFPTAYFYPNTCRKNFEPIANPGGDPFTL